MKLNILNVVGIGPGDPELITLKAINAIKNSNFIFYPSVSSGQNKFAYETIRKGLEISGYLDFLKDEERFIPLEVEMKLSKGRNNRLYKENAIKIIEKLNSGACSYVTVGDPMFYSTFWGVYNAIKVEAGNNFNFDFKVNIINGISSLNYALGLIGIPFIIKNSSVLISVPVKKDKAEIKREVEFIAGKHPDSRPNIIVFMKAGAYVKNILEVFKESYLDEFKSGLIKLYLIEKSNLIDNFIDCEINLKDGYMTGDPIAGGKSAVSELADNYGMDKGFDYFSILIGVFL